MVSSSPVISDSPAAACPSQSTEQILEDTTVPQLFTPPSSGKTSPTPNEVGEQFDVCSQHKKKKKKKSKKSAKTKDAVVEQQEPVDARPTMLCISRNKHWKYISSYHGPWLQLPIELLETLLVMNLDPATIPTPEPRSPIHTKPRDHGFRNLGDHYFSESLSPRNMLTTTSLPPINVMPTLPPGKATPPPIDPGVFRSVTSIRRLIDEAAELSVRASSGLSAAALGSLRGGAAGSGSNNPWNVANAFGINPLGDNAGGGRNVAMSAMRIHRLRALAAQKLAQAYKADEIASSVMVMQGGSVFDDVAERVLKVDPNDMNAKYVHFFHERIPSRQLAESTTTNVLDELIAVSPQQLEFYRTRGIVHCFRDEFPQATKDFTHALKETRAARKAKSVHGNSSSRSESQTRSSKRKKATKSNGRAPPSGTSSLSDIGSEAPDEELVVIHPSALPDAPDPLELQLLFLRGATYLQHAVFLIEEAILKLEGISKVPPIDGAELRLCYIEDGKYGGVEVGHPDGPLGKKNGAKVKAYRQVFADTTFMEQIGVLLKKSVRDHERFLSHFDTLEGLNLTCDGDDLARRVTHAFVLSESIRPGNHSNPPPAATEPNSIITTYHPLRVESHFSILICQLMLAEFTTILPMFVRVVSLVEALEGYPVFLPPRSMAQAEFIEVLERLAGGWKNGIQPHSYSCTSFGKLAIEAPPLAQFSPSPSPSPSVDGHSCASSSDHHDPHAPSTSTAGSQNGHGTTSTSTIHQHQNHHQHYQNHASPAELTESLDCLRVLLAPVAARQKQRAEKAAAEKVGAAGKKKAVPISIPLHGPRVEVILAWLAAVYLVELDSVA